MTDAPVALITGGASGIGAATTRRLLDQAHRVAITGRDRDRLGRFAESLGEPAGLLSLAGDAADYIAVQAAVEATVHEFGRLDTVVANAGFAAQDTLADGDPDRWREMVLTNVLGPALLIRAALPALRRTRGRIVLIGSVAGFVHTPGNIYGVTKWAVTGLAENTRRLVTGDGIGVTLIAPGRVATPFWDAIGSSCRWTADRRPDRRRHCVGDQPAERCRRQHRDCQADRSAYVIAIICRDHDRRRPAMSTPRDHTTRTDTAGAGTLRLGGDRSVNRLGFGAMRLPADPGQAHALLRRAVELGVGLIDTAEFYGPGTSEQLIAEALWPYPDTLVIATKGLTHPPDRWGQPGQPQRLRQAVEGSLRRLRLERIELYQLARIDPTVPAADQFGMLAELRQQGKIGHVGLSEVGVDQVQTAQKVVPVVSVQNRYSLADRAWEPVVDHCEREGMAFLPWFPLGAGRLVEAGGALGAVARRHQAATPAQVALAWLLRRSPVMLPIPGTSSVAHLPENLAAAALRLTDDEFRLLDSM